MNYYTPLTPHPSFSAVINITDENLKGKCNVHLLFPEVKSMPQSMQNFKALLFPLVSLFFLLGKTLNSCQQRMEVLISHTLANPEHHYLRNLCVFLPYPCSSVYLSPTVSFLVPICLRKSFRITEIPSQSCFRMMFGTLLKWVCRASRIRYKVDTKNYKKSL